MLPALPFDVASLLAVSARRWPDRFALRSDSAAMRYGELQNRVSRLADSLRAQGIAPGDRVVVLMPNGMRFVESWWAVISTGAIVVPVNHRCAVEELHYFIEDCSPRCIIADAARFAAVDSLCRLPQLEGSLLVCVDGVRAGAHSYEDLIAHGRTGSAHAPRDLSEPCAIYYTAGTTGRSKGVVRSHLSVAWGLAMIAQHMSRDDVLLARAPMAHAGGSLTGPFAVLLAGGTLVIPDRTEPEALLGAVEAYKVSRCYVHPVLSAKALIAALGGHKPDLVMSDMAAPTTGHRATDHLRIMALADAALDFAEDVLAPGGAFVCKVFQGGAEGDLLARLKQSFAIVRHAKPKASRQDSSEMYVVATGFRGERTTREADKASEEGGSSARRAGGKSKGE